MNVLLISTYELGRQPFGLASPAAWLRREGATVTCLDLAVQRLRETAVADADLVAIHLPMHTATRIAARVAERIQKINPTAHLCFYGLYAPVNESYLRELGADTILGGEFEGGLVALVRRLSSPESGGPTNVQSEPIVSLSRLQFLAPDRKGLPELAKYAHVEMPDGSRRTVGYTEASRGCKHLCRHCPIVPVYRGNFRIVQRQVVLEDIRQLVEAGAAHITFGDPDFFNGPRHAVAIITDLHEKFPQVTYDVTIKIEHLLGFPHLLPVLRDTGCVLVTSAVESVDDRVLAIFAKNHTRQDFFRVVAMFREVRLALNPTFVTFTPWTTLDGYLELLTVLSDLDLVDSVSPVQYGIRLLIPAGSKLLELPEVRQIVGTFDGTALFYPWHHANPEVDRLHSNVMQLVKESHERKETRRQVFGRVWKLALEAYDRSVTRGFRSIDLVHAPPRATIPYVSEPWFC